MDTAQDTRTAPKNTDTRHNGRASKVRHIRVPDDMWENVAAKAESEDLTIAQVTRRLYREYLERD